MLSGLPLTQEFRKVCQSNHNNRQSGNITDMHPAVKHPRYDNRQKGAEDRSNKKYLKLIQIVTLSVVNT
jgi:hypothetical protein